jgi:hypothetical protein
MKYPLRVGPADNPKKIQIFDATGRAFCTMDFAELAFAQRIVRRENGWWLTLFGPPRDERQRRYDNWIAERNHYHGLK